MASNIYGIFVFALVYGCFAGSFISVLPVVLAEFFGADRMASVSGLIYNGFALGNLLGPPIAGFVFDETGSYSVGVWLAATSILVAFATLHCVQPTEEPKKI